MKILFINAVSPLNEVESRYPGLGLAYLASSLRANFEKNYFELKIIECGSEREVEGEILAFEPDIICISSVTKNFSLAEQYARFSRGKNIPVLMGGVHISMFPMSLPEAADAACIGEGEQTLVELVKIFKEKRIFEKKELSRISGIVYRNEKEELIITGSRDLVEPLDNIARPARDLLKIGQHSYVFSSRGCPYRCTFCASSRFWNKVRLFSAEYVVKEIGELYEKYNVRIISFFDDLFIISPQRIAEITELLSRDGLLGKIKFTCSCRANLVNEGVAKLLKKMGVVSVGLGLESGSERVLKYLKGDSTSIEQNRNAVKVFKKYGITVNASFVIGSPDETMAEMMETYNFIKNNPLDLVDIYVLMPFPGTPVWDYAKQRGLVSDNMDWSSLTSDFEADYKKAVIVSELYNREKMYEIYKKFQRLRLYKNAKNIWRSPFLVDLPRYILKAAKRKFLLARGYFTEH